MEWLHCLALAPGGERFTLTQPVPRPCLLWIASRCSMQLATFLDQQKAELSPPDILQRRSMRTSLRSAVPPWITILYCTP